MSEPGRPPTIQASRECRRDAAPSAAGRATGGRRAALTDLVVAATLAPGPRAARISGQTRIEAILARDMVAPTVASNAGAPTLYCVLRRLKRAVKLVLEALPIVPACRLLAGRRLELVPIAFCIDIEPDTRKDGPGAVSWTGFEQLHRGFVPPLRRQLSELTGQPARITWGIRMDDQITRTWGSPTWAADNYREELDALQDQGDEFGLHIHPWHWDDEAGDWVVDHTPSWVARCVNVGLDAYESAFGRPARTFRSGDGAMSGAMLQVLSDRRVMTDVTLEHGLTQWKPFAGETRAGEPFDSSRVPTDPYRSSPAAFPAPDPASDADPLLMPLFGGPARRGRWGGTLVLGTHPTFFAVRLLLTLLRRSPRVLLFAVRGDSELIAAWDPFVRNLTHLARHPGARFVTTSEAAQLVAGRDSRGSPIGAPA